MTDQAWVSFVIYLVFFDFVHYWMHRAQHQSSAWWALHALHHSQCQMNMWSDNRNHLLDDVLVDVVWVVVALLIGVGPGQFVALVGGSRIVREGRRDWSDRTQQAAQRASDRTEDSWVAGFDYLARSGSTAGLQVRRLGNHRGSSQPQLKTPQPGRMAR